MRLKDADVLIRAVHDEWDECLVWDESGATTADEVERIINDAPTIDAVPVVRCKDCKWWGLSEYNTFGIHVCKKFSGVRGESDFCSRGERSE